MAAKVAVTVGGKGIGEIVDLPVDRAFAFFDSLPLRRGAELVPALQASARELPNEYDKVRDTVLRKLDARKEFRLEGF